jgi:hypothetical protein
MQSHIPDDLGLEVARLAAGLNLDLDTAVRQALETWIRQVRCTGSKRAPDEPIFFGDRFDSPCELPRTSPKIVAVTSRAQRMPDGIGLQ